MPDYSSLKALLRRIAEADTPPCDYTTRNRLIYMALGRAAAQHVPCGVRLDPAESAWPVAFIELPTGQVSWHVPPHQKSWDGHTTEEKYRRIGEYTGG